MLSGLAAILCNFHYQISKYTPCAKQLIHFHPPNQQEVHFPTIFLNIYRILLMLHRVIIIHSLISYWFKKIEEKQNAEARMKKIHTLHIEVINSGSQYYHARKPDLKENNREHL